MSIIIESIIRAATRKNSEPLNIILVGASERYEGYLSHTGHNFYSFGKRWNHLAHLIPENLKEVFSLEYGLGYDLVLCLGRKRDLAKAKVISKNYHIPLVLAELDFPNPNQEVLKEEGDINVFINKSQAAAWGFKKDYLTINNCVDINLFTLGDTKRELTAMTAIHFWKERDWSHGFRNYHRSIKDTPNKIFGSDKFLHWQDLVDEYRKTKIYFNPTVRVAQPLQILEAMSAGCIVVALDNELNRELITDKMNGFLVTEQNAAETIKQILATDWKVLRPVQYGAADTIHHYSLESFVNNWNQVFHQAANTPFIGK